MILHKTAWNDTKKQRIVDLLEKEKEGIALPEELVELDRLQLEKIEFNQKVIPLFSKKVQAMKGQSKGKK